MLHSFKLIWIIGCGRRASSPTCTLVICKTCHNSAAHLKHHTHSFKWIFFSGVWTEWFTSHRCKIHHESWYPLSTAPCCSSVSCNKLQSAVYVLALALPLTRLCLIKWELKSLKWIHEWVAANDSPCSLNCKARSFHSSFWPGLFPECH